MQYYSEIYRLSKVPDPQYAKSRESIETHISCSYLPLLGIVFRNKSIHAPSAFEHHFHDRGPIKL